MHPTSQLLAGALLVLSPQVTPPPEPAPPAEEEAPQDLFVERGEGLVPIRIPRAEKLEYRVRIDLGLIEASVGRVTMTSSVEPYRHSLILVGNSTGQELETGHFRTHAKGDYSLYSMDATIDTRLLPQAWPYLSYSYVHRGTENRRREILVGIKDGKRQSSYRKDTRKGAPKGTRIWKAPKFREVPEGTVDMLTALYLTRAVVRDQLEELVFPLIDKDRLWQIRMTRGETRQIETEAGEFKVVQLLLAPGAYPGEELDEEKREKFEGLFGIHGSIRIWGDHVTGIPIRIQGDLPLGPLTLGIDVELEAYSGTAIEFQPVPE